MLNKASASFVVMALACAVVGWLLVQRRNIEQPQHTTSQTQATPYAREATASVRPESELARRNAAIAALSDAATRSAAWVDWLTELAQTDPKLAAERALALGESAGQAEALREVMQVWLASTPDAANAWLLARVDGLPAACVLALARVVAGFDVAPALQLAAALPAGLRASALREVFGEWAAHSPWAAAHTAEQLTEASDRVAATGEVARLWAHTDAQAALTWSRELSDVQLRRVALDALVDSWTEAAPADAAAALLTLPADAARARSLDRVLAVWSTTDADAAHQFVQQLREPAERESAATTLVLQHMLTQPARAAEWARGLQLGSNSPLFEKLVTAWVARDANAAVAWAQALPARESERVELLTLALSRWQEQDAQGYRQWQIAQLAHQGQP